MDMPTLVGVAGIVVSIVVGLGTYYFAERSGRRSRWQAAKNLVLHDLSKSLGEGNVPNPSVMLATIRSVLREQNAADLEAVTLEEVADDLIRQVTSDPFLDSERRIDLQNKVMELKDTHLRDIEKMLKTSPPTAQDEIRSPASLLPVIAGLFASLLASIVVVGLPDLITRLQGSLHMLTLKYTELLLSLGVLATAFALRAVVTWAKSFLERKRK